MLRFNLTMVSCFMLYFICAFHTNASGQNCDTIYYHDGSVLMITTKINETDSVLLCHDIDGKNILVSDAISYQFFDKKFNKKRTVTIIDKVLHEDYCISESDTIYQYIQHHDAFDLTLKQLYSYLEQQVVYPKNALKKGIQAQVKISMVIDKKGVITQITSLTKHEWGFEESLIKTISDKKQFGFVLYHNKPVNYYLEIPFAFVIKKR